MRTGTRFAVGPYTQGEEGMVETRRRWEGIVARRRPGRDDQVAGTVVEMVVVGGDVVQAAADAEAAMCSLVDEEVELCGCSVASSMG